MSVARLLVWLVLGATGCSLGSGNIAPDRFDYTEAIARSNHEQLLANLVRLRYSEPPVFLGVGSVLTQYVYSGRVSAEGSLAEDTDVTPGWSTGLGLTGIYIERPTISYTPLVGQDFTQQLLAPIDSEAVFSLAQSGWSPEELLKLTLERINHVDGRLSRAVPDAADLAALREFRRVIDLLLRVSARHAVEMQREPDEDVRYLVFAEETDPDTAALIDELKTTLDLDPELSRYRVTDRDIRAPDEITIRVRSFGAMLGLESRGIQVPAEHIAEQRAERMTTPDEDEDIASLVRLRVLASSDEPEDAFVSVRHEGTWFYIPDNDHRSKQTFGLLGYLFQVQSPEVQSVGGPVLTVPTG